MKKSTRILGLGFVGTILLYSDFCLAQAPATPIAYPARGQNPEQQQQDQFACYSWAKQQTGFDPSQPPPKPPSQPMQGGPLRRMEEEKQAAQVQAQAAAQEQQKAQLYYRAWTACMTGRGYAVK